MSLLGMRYFLVAAEEMNFTSAAKRLYITQQTLSAHILRLEQEYGVVLFNRKPRLSLTREGERMVKYATRIVRLERVMSAEFADLSQSARGALSLGVSRMRAKHFFHELWAAYRKQFPNIEIYLSEGPSATLERLVERHSVDMCIGVNLEPSTAICRIPLLSETVYLAVPRDLFHAHYPEQTTRYLNAFSQGLSFSQIPDLPLLLLSPINRIRRLVDQGFDALDRIAHPVFESNDLELLLSMCEKGAGQAFVPASSLFYAQDMALKMDRIYAFPLQNTTIETMLGYPSDLELPHYAQLFIASCQSVFAQANETIRQQSNAYFSSLQKQID